MAIDKDTIGPGKPSRPNTRFWTGQADKIVEDSLPMMREAAKALIMGLGVLQGVYLAILGFGGIAERFAPLDRVLLVVPTLFWLLGLVCCLCLLSASPRQLALPSSENIQKAHAEILKEKQMYLWVGFLALAVGLLVALFIIAYLPDLMAIH